MVYTVTFNTFDLSNYMKVLSVQRSVLPPRSPQLQEIAGKKGAHLMGINTGVKNFEVKGIIKGTSIEDLQTRCQDLAGILNVEEEKAFTISDTPNKFWMAVPVEETDLDDQQNKAFITINFLAPDPLATGDLVEGALVTNATTEVSNPGNAEASPRVKVTFTQDANHCTIVSPDGFVMIGNPETPDKITRKPEERIMWDEMNDLSRWSTTGTQIDFGNQDGSLALEQSNTAFGVGDYGDLGHWHGPAAIRDVQDSNGNPVLLQDWKVEMIVQMTNSLDENSRIELTLFDDVGNELGTMVLWDRHMKEELMEGVIYAGTSADGFRIIDDYGKKKFDWNNFEGVIKLKRVGTEWHAAIAPFLPGGGNRYDYDKHIYKHRIIPPYAHQGKLGSIQLHMTKYGTTPNPTIHRIRDIKVYRINQVTEEEIPTLFKADDVLELDFETGEVWKNGENFLNYYDPGSRFFKLVPGTTEVAVRTNDPNAVVEYEFNQRWLA